jgi:hypothetical protein
MGQNLDDYPGFQKTPGMPILLQHSVVVRSCIQNHFQHAVLSFAQRTVRGYDIIS